MDARFDSLAGKISLYSHDNIYYFDWDGNYVSRKEIRDTSWNGADVHNFCVGHTESNRINITVFPDSCIFVFKNESKNSEDTMVSQNAMYRLPVHKLPSGEKIDVPLSRLKFYFYDDYVAYHDVNSSYYCRLYPDGRTEYPYAFDSDSQSKSGVKCVMWQMLETDNYLFSSIGSGDLYRMVYFKKRDAMRCLKAKSKGLTNDIDRDGPEFWPDGRTQDGQLFMRRSAKWFKKACNESDNPKVQRIGFGVQNYGNPVIVIATVR